MDIDDLRNYCLNKKGVSEGFPFDQETLVFKVGTKMFCLTNLSKSFSINLKCDPEKAIELREEFEEVSPGYHMNKLHWNTVNAEGKLTDKQIIEMIDHSYDLVVKKMSRKERISNDLDN